MTSTYRDIKRAQGTNTNVTPVRNVFAITIWVFFVCKRTGSDVNRLTGQGRTLNNALHVPIYM